MERYRRHIHMTRDKLKVGYGVCYIALLILLVSIWVRHSIPWWEFITPFVLLYSVTRMLRLFSLADGMLHQYVHRTLKAKHDKWDLITDKVLNHTHKKSNKRYKMKKKRKR